MTGTPKHLWIVGVLALLWNGMGAMNYVVTQLKVDAFMSQYTQEQLDYYYGFPAWAIAFWAIAVWFGVTGCVLLLMRKRIAETIFLISFASMVINSIYSYGMSNGMEIQGTGGFAFSLVIFVVSLGLWLYARTMRARGVLT